MSTSRSIRDIVVGVSWPVSIKKYCPFSWQCFATVRIAPHLGSLDRLTATFPHPGGDIKIEYRREGSGLDATITLPADLTGSFLYNGKTQPLHTGLNKIQAK